MFKKNTEYQPVEEEKSSYYDHENIDPDSLIIDNPQYYNAYILAGDYCFRLQQFSRALGYYQRALSKVIATKQEEASVEHKIIKCKSKL